MPNNSTGALADAFELSFWKVGWFAGFGVYIEHTERERPNVIPFEYNCHLPHRRISRDKDRIDGIVKRSNCVNQVTVGVAVNRPNCLAWVGNQWINWRTMAWYSTLALR
jgi:hypothetical protein